MKKRKVTDNNEQDVHRGNSMTEDQRRRIERWGAPTAKIAIDPDWFPDVDCIIPIRGNSYKASEGIRDGDLGLVSVRRNPQPGDLVLAETPLDGRCLMRIVPAAQPFLRSDNPKIRDVPLDAEGLSVVGVLVDTMRNPPLVRNVEGQRIELKAQRGASK